MKKRVMLRLALALHRAWLRCGKILVRASGLEHPKNYVTLLAVQHAAESMLFVVNRCQERK